MSGVAPDPLDRIAVDLRHYLLVPERGIPLSLLDDADALVEVARAARAELGGDEKIAEYLEIIERNSTDVVDLTAIPRFALAAALARLGQP